MLELDRHCFLCQSYLSSEGKCRQKLWGKVADAKAQCLHFSNVISWWLYVSYFIYTENPNIVAISQGYVKLSVYTQAQSYIVFTCPSGLSRTMKQAVLPYILIPPNFCLATTAIFNHSFPKATAFFSQTREIRQVNRRDRNCIFRFISVDFIYLGEKSLSTVIKW